MRLTVRSLAVALLALVSAPSFAAEKTPLIFIHGIEGAELINSKGETVWLTATEVLGLRTPDLKLPLTWNREEQTRDDLHAGETLRSVRLIPGIYKASIYDKWLDAAAAMGRPFYSFAYDWRRDNLETLANFERFVKEVRLKNNGARVRVVAHSMGGLVTLALLNQHPEYFESAVFAGVPFAGGIGFLRDLQLGGDIGLNHRILAPDVLMTYPSIFSLFPLNGAGLSDRNGSAVSMDFFSADEWKAKRLGVYAQSDSPKPDYDAFLKVALPRARKFRLLLAPRASALYPPVLVIVGRGNPTLVKVQSQGPKSVHGWDLVSAPQVSGDGRVEEAAAVPPVGILYRVFHSLSPHSALLNDPDVIQEIAKFP